MKQLIFISIFCLTTAMHICAQTPIVKMTTTNERVFFYVAWTGTGSITANGVELKNDSDIVNTISAASDGSVVFVAVGDAQLTHLWCYSNSLTALNVANCMELTSLDCAYNSLSALDMTNCPKSSELSAGHQTLALPVARIDDNKLSIKNPIIFTGAEVSIENISHDGICTGDSITWERTRESGKVTFDFTTELPNGVTGEPLFGMATQPWTKTGTSEKMQTWIQDPIVTMTTADDSVRIYVEWTGTGSISANGMELNNSYYEGNTIFPTINGLVVVTATRDAQLTYLHCNDNSLTALNLKYCPRLENLNCRDNSLTALDMTNCPELTTMRCDFNFPMTTLDVSNCPKLTYLDCYNNSLTALDITKCAKLTELWCYNNSLTILDVTKCSELTILSCGSNSLSALDVTKCSELTKLFCSKNSLTALDITKSLTLIEMSCSQNSLTTLDVTNCPELTYLDCDNNMLTTLDVTKCPKLEVLKYSDNSIYTLNVTKCPELWWLNCSHNLLTTLDITNCPKLEGLYCNNNSLTNLNITNCPKLTHLYCNNNPLHALNVAKNLELEYLECDNNLLTTLDVTKCTKLTHLYCHNNSILTLDVTKCPKLNNLFARNQNSTLPEAVVNSSELSIENPVTFAGVEVKIDSISHGGTYADGSITWDVSGESGEVTFDFEVKLPSGIIGSSFSGTVTQPWTTK